jgi:hypothetical protein
MGKICALAAVGVCLVLAGSATAGSSDYVTLKFTGEGLAMPGLVSYDHRTLLVQVGQSDFDVITRPGSYAGLGQTIVDATAPSHETTGWCIDVYQSIYMNETAKFKVMDLGLAPTLQDPSRADDLERLFSKYADLVDTNCEAAAFQAAIWEIVNEPATPIYEWVGTGRHKHKVLTGYADPVYDVDGGSFKVIPTCGQHWDQLANQWLNNLGDGSVDAFALVNCNVQDFAWILPGQGGRPPVPEPLTMVSGFLAVSGLGFYVRKRTKVHSAV